MVVCRSVAASGSRKPEAFPSATTFLSHDLRRQPWVNSTRTFLRHVRTFFLVKSGTESLDSRSVGALGCRIDAVVGDAAVFERQPVTIDATVRNTGGGVWLKPETEYGGVALGAHLYDGSGNLIAFDLVRQQKRRY